jgi:hypothetical protein
MAVGTRDKGSCKAIPVYWRGGHAYFVFLRATGSQSVVARFDRSSAPRPRRLEDVWCFRLDQPRLATMPAKMSPVADADNGNTKRYPALLRTISIARIENVRDV